MPEPDSLQRHEIPVGQASAALAGVLMLFIRGYQRLLSPLLGPVCRFEPSCSRYGHECLRLHGAFRGSYLAVRRILRCHPFHPGGYDPPPLPRVSEHQSPARHPGEEPPSHGDPAVVPPTPPAL